MLERLERQEKLTGNQWKIIATAGVGDMLDFFDALPAAPGSTEHWEPRLCLSVWNSKRSLPPISGGSS